MKTNTSAPQKSTKPQQSANTQQNHSGKRADNKNNLDSREGEEQLTKADDITHNRKEKQSERKKK